MVLKCTENKEMPENKEGEEVLQALYSLWRDHSGAGIHTAAHAGAGGHALKELAPHRVIKKLNWFSQSQVCFAHDSNW